MKVSALASTVALGLVLSMPAAQVVHAGFNNVQSCKAADGTSVYTDGACGQLRARPAAMSRDLNLRLSNENAIAAQMGVAPQGAGIGGVVPSAEGIAAPARRSLAAGCARTPTQLAMDLQGSVALHDVNRLAESYHWVGMSQAQAKPVMLRLEAMSSGAMVSARFFDATIGSGLQLADANSTAADGGAGVMQVSMHGREGTQSLEMNVEHYAGCYFVHF